MLGQNKTIKETIVFRTEEIFASDWTLNWIFQMKEGNLFPATENHF